MTTGSAISSALKNAPCKRFCMLTNAFMNAQMAFINRSPLRFAPSVLLNVRLALVAQTRIVLNAPTAMSGKMSFV